MDRFPLVNCAEGDDDIYIYIYIIRSIVLLSRLIVVDGSIDL